MHGLGVIAPPFQAYPGDFHQAVLRPDYAMDRFTARWSVAGDAGSALNWPVRVAAVLGYDWPGPVRVMLEWHVHHSMG